MDPPAASSDRIGPVSHFLIEARPGPGAAEVHELAGAIVSVWVLEPDLATAERYARTYVEDHCWIVDEVTSRLQPSLDQIAAIEAAEYERCVEACSFGISATFLAYPHATASQPLTESPTTIRRLVAPRTPGQEATFWRYERHSRRVFSKKYCLHPEAGPTCGKIAMAHSVQRRVALSAIAKAGHIYRIDGDAETLRRNGRPGVSLVGVGEASTFAGLCGLHDAETFRPIDQRPFTGDLEQVFLLAYRAILRATYIQRAAHDSGESLRALADTQSEPRRGALMRLAESHLAGVAHGLRTIAAQKALFDRMLATRIWDDLRFVLFRLGRLPDVLISAATCPTTDFDGNMLENAQRLGAIDGTPDLLTISSCPGDGGGMLVLAWHRSSDRACNQLAGSLIRVKPSRLSDAFVRLAFSGLENVFLRPEWWETLTPEDQSRLLARMEESFNPTKPIRAEELCDDGHSIAFWNPASVAVRVTNGRDILTTDEELTAS